MVFVKAITLLISSPFHTTLTLALFQTVNLEVKLCLVKLQFLSNAVFVCWARSMVRYANISWIKGLRLKLWKDLTQPGSEVRANVRTHIVRLQSWT